MNRRVSLLALLLSIVSGVQSSHDVSSRSLLRTSCRALYNNRRLNYTNDFIKEVTLATDGRVDGGNDCCFECNSEDKCRYFTYYQPCKSTKFSGKPCKGQCWLFGEKAKVSYKVTGCGGRSDTGPDCKYITGKRNMGIIQ